MMDKDQYLEPFLKEAIKAVVPAPSPEFAHFDQTKLELIKVVLNHLKSKLKALNNEHLEILVRALVHIKSADKKSVGSVLLLVANRVNAVGYTLLLAALRLIVQQRKEQLDIYKPYVVQFLKKLIERKLLRHFDLRSSALMLQVISQLDQSSFFATTEHLKQYFLSEIIELSRARLHQTVSPADSKGIGLSNPMNVVYLTSIIDKLSEMKVENRIVTELVINMPDQIARTSTNIHRVRYLLMIHANEKNALDSEHLLKIKKSLFSISKQLSRYVAKTVSKQLEIFQILLDIEKIFDFPVPAKFKKITAILFVHKSYQLSLEEILKGMQLLRANIKSADQVLAGILRRFAFDEYSDLTQIEFRFRAEAEEGPEGEEVERSEEAEESGVKYEGFLKYPSFQQVKEKFGGSPVIMKIQTLLVNSVLMYQHLALSAPKESLPPADLTLAALKSAVNPRFLTKEAVNRLLLIRLIYGHLPVPMDSVSSTFAPLSSYFRQFSEAKLKELSKSKLEGLISSLDLHEVRFQHVGSSGLLYDLYSEPTRTGVVILNGCNGAREVKAKLEELQAVAGEDANKDREKLVVYLA